MSFVVHDGTPWEDAAPPPGFSTGLIQRNYSSHPPGYLPCAEPFPDEMLVPESAQQARLDAQVVEHASLYDLRMDNYDVLKSLNQDGLGLCWAFSSTKSCMYLRVAMGEPPVRLSAWWVAGKVKGWRDQGGWGAESLEQISTGGAPIESLCPSYKSSYDTEETRNNALLHRATEWWDGSNDRERNRRIMISAFLLGLAPVLDYNWLGHSMCGCRLVSLNPLTVDCDNSWGEISQYGEKGLYRIQGSRAIPDGIVVPRVVRPSLV